MLTQRWRTSTFHDAFPTTKSPKQSQSDWDPQFLIQRIYIALTLERSLPSDKKNQMSRSIVTIFLLQSHAHKILLIQWVSIVVQRIRIQTNPSILQQSTRHWIACGIGFQQEWLPTPHEPEGIALVSGLLAATWPKKEEVSCRPTKAQGITGIRPPPDVLDVIRYAGRWFMASRQSDSLIFPLWKVQAFFSPACNACRWIGILWIAMSW